MASPVLSTADLTPVDWNFRSDFLSILHNGARDLEPSAIWKDAFDRAMVTMRIQCSAHERVQFLWDIVLKTSSTLTDAILPYLQGDALWILACMLYLRFIVFAHPWGVESRDLIARRQLPSLLRVIDGDLERLTAEVIRKDINAHPGWMKAIPNSASGDAVGVMNEAARHAFDHEWDAHIHAEIKRRNEGMISALQQASPTVPKYATARQRIAAGTAPNQPTDLAKLIASFASPSSTFKHGVSDEDVDMTK